MFICLQFRLFLKKSLPIQIRRPPVVARAVLAEPAARPAERPVERPAVPQAVQPVARQAARRVVQLVAQPLVAQPVVLPQRALLLRVLQRPLFLP